MMRTIKVSAFTALLSLQAAAIPAPGCHSNQSLSVEPPTGFKILNVVENTFRVSSIISSLLHFDLEYPAHRHEEDPQESHKFNVRATKPKTPPKKKRVKCSDLIKQVDADEKKQKRAEVPRHINYEITHFLHRREPKKYPKIPRFQSNNFDSWSAHIDRRPQTRAYGWRNEDDCASYTWTTQVIPGVRFQTEHLLEWQVIGEFFSSLFDIMDAEVRNKHRQPFINPDPNINKEVRFKQYWMAHWDREAFQLPNHASARTPFQYIADEYPSNTDHTNELVGLQAQLNGLKGRLFKRNEAQTQAFDRSRMVNLMKANRQAEVLIRLRRAVGLSRYFEETSQIFRDQVRRIRAILVQLDDNLHSHPPVSTDDESITYRPWTRINIGHYWDEYMDNVWRGMSDELDGFMKDFYDQFNHIVCSPTEIANYRNLNNAPATRGDYQYWVDLCDNFLKLKPQYQRYRGAPNRPW